MRIALLLGTAFCTIGRSAGAQGSAGAPLAVASAEPIRVALTPLPTTPRVADPADSLYRLGRAALNDGDYRRAASLFATVAERYPDSEYAADALYYRAYALYRLGTSKELAIAVKALDLQAARYPHAATLGDAKQLRASIRAEQAKRGDGDAGKEVTESVKDLGTEQQCPNADTEMRLTALLGLYQQDPDQVLPVLQKLLERRDNCSAQLRKQALYLVAQGKEEDRADILLHVASTDPSMDVRREAVQWLSQVNTERAARALDSILFSTTDAELRDRAVYALSQHRSLSARQSLHRFAELSTIPIEQRVRAVHYLGMAGRRGPDESEYLRGLFDKTASPDLKEAIVQAVASQNTPDRTAWLLGVARDRKQELEPRKKALYFAAMRTTPLSELTPLYDEMNGQPEMQDQLLYVYGQRKEPEATDKLMQIAKSEKNVDLRKRAIFWLGQRKDPRVKQFLIDLLNR